MTLSYSRNGLAGAGLALLLAASTGCGLISSDVADFNLALPDKSFSIELRHPLGDPRSRGCLQPAGSICGSSGAGCRRVHASGADPRSRGRR